MFKRPLVAFIPLVALLFVHLSCDEETKDTSVELEPFCITIEDGDDWRMEGAGGGSTSGSFAGRLVTDASTDIGAVEYVANVDYTVENIDIGCTTQTRDRTDSGGYFYGSGAAGRWRFQAGAVVDSHQCSADMEFEVEVGKNTSVCAVIRCE